MRLAPQILVVFRLRFFIPLSNAVKKRAENGNNIKSKRAQNDIACHLPNLYVGKDGIKINDTANTKLDRIIGKLEKLERDVVALQIMNEHMTPCERLKLYDYYKNELHGNSFIDEYIAEVRTHIDKTRFS